MSTKERPSWFLTREIHEVVSSHGAERAMHLRALYKKISRVPCPRERYLDIGAGDAMASVIFGNGFYETCLIDLKPPKKATYKQQESVLHYIVGDACALPFIDNSFDAVSMFSLIEHVPNRHRAIREALRVLKPNGELIVQFPNRFFCLDLHTGLPNPVFLPRRVRQKVLSRLGYGWWSNHVNIPTTKELEQWVKPSAILLGMQEVNYPPSLIPPQFHKIYKLVKKMGLLNLMPMGYICVYQKIQSSHGDTATC